MEIIELKLKDIIPYEKNPRNNREAIKYVTESIKQFGFKNPIILDENNVIICGHTRYASAKKLKLESVPCIIADDLSEEQVKAFRLADNKVSEYAIWDLDLLNEELSNIFKIDMSDLGFDDFDFNLELEQDEEETEHKENERERTNNTYNLRIYDETMVDGKYQMPIIKNDNFIPKDIIGFNYAKTSEEKNVGIHFYLDDYQFERVWNNPEEYIEILQEYECIFSPDFSLYLDMPIAMKIWNIYRSRLIGQYYQGFGIKVIPTISWAEKETFEFCFDGIPKGSIVSISTIGVKRDEEAFKIWKDGVDEMIKRIEPSAILIYGGEVDYNYGNIKVIYYDNNVTERMKKLKK